MFVNFVEYGIHQFVNLSRICVKLHGKNGFAEVSKNLARYRSENNFYRNNDIGRLSSLLKCQNFLQHCIMLEFSA